MKLYLVRHGQSVANATKIHSGWSQVPLTAQGETDAERAGQYLRTLQFDRIYSSDLLRAIQTASIALPGSAPEQLPLIRERNVGVLVGRPFEECAEEYGDAYWQARASVDFTPFGGDSPDMVRARASAFLKMLENDPAENIAAFTHGGFILHCIEHVLHAEIPVPLVTITNGTIVRLSHDGDHWRMIF